METKYSNEKWVQKVSFRDVLRKAQHREIETTTFENIFSENLKSRLPSEDYKGDDSLFGNVAARNAFKKFQKFHRCSQNELRILALIWFDVVITDGLDAFQVEITSHEAKSLPDFSHGYGDQRWETLSNHEKLRKGGTVPQESSKGLNELLPV